MANVRETKRRELEIQRRRDRVIELRDEGRTFREIAAELGVSVALVHSDFKAAIAQIPVKSVETYREHQLQHLATERAIVEDVLARNHVTISDGRVVYDEDGVVIDDGPVLQAVDRLLKIHDREAKLLGLDARPEVQVTGNLSYKITGFDDGDA